MMRFRKIMLLVAACMAIAAVSANAAQAAEHWTINGAELAGEESVAVSGGPWTLEATVLGQPLKITASSVECTPGVTCKIKGTGESTGSLTYTGVTVDPSTCSVPGGTITTTGLKDKIKMINGKTWDVFFPATGELFTEFELVGAECPLAEFNVEVKGEVAGRTEETGVELVSQPVTFSQALEEESGSTLHIGSAIPAILTGVAHNALSGANASKKFGATE